MEIYFIFTLQIINILISGIMPVISNFIQTITLSECCGLKIKRKLKSIRTNNNNDHNDNNNNNNDNDIIINDIQNTI